jgi:trimeric autotransporter adhesin
MSGSNNIEIGHVRGSGSESNTIRIGTPGTQTATYLAGVRGVAIAGAQPLAVNANGQLGVRASSAQFKEAVKPIGRQSETILCLHPVSFRYKKELDPSGEAQFGLVAEDVAKVAPELVVHDQQGKSLSVRYEEINAMLLNEFIKEHNKVEELEATVATLAATVKEQAARTQKVDAALEVSKLGAQLVVTEH